MTTAAKEGGVEPAPKQMRSPGKSWLWDKPRSPAPSLPLFLKLQSALCGAGPSAAGLKERNCSRKLYM